MLRIAVTGGIACGKSICARFLEEEGIPVCDADELAHQLLEPRTAVYKKVVSYFGDKFLNRDGSINRTRLGKHVFNRPAELKRLNSFIHPSVKGQWRKWLTGQKNVPVAAVIVPLLYEVGEGAKWDAVICVAAKKDTQMRRLRERGLSSAESNRRIRAQIETRKKAVLADYVVWNDGSERILKEQMLRVVRSVLER